MKTRCQGLEASKLYVEDNYNLVDLPNHVVPENVDFDGILSDGPKNLWLESAIVKHGQNYGPNQGGYTNSTIWRFGIRV